MKMKIVKKLPLKQVQMLESGTRHSIKILQWVEKNNQVNTTKTTMAIPLPSHYAYAVYDKETGKMMEMIEHRNHPNSEIREACKLSSANKYRRLLNGIVKKKKTL